MIIPCMMVRDEEKIIRRCLDSISTIGPDAILITDTGSADKTMDIITEFSNETGIKLKLVQVPWVNFGENRTIVFKETAKFAAELGFPLDSSYALFIDADMVIRSSRYIKDILGILTDDIYEVNFINGDVIYRKTAIVKLSIDCKSVGKVHEYWDVKGKTSFLGALSLIERNDGKSREEKYERDLAIFEEEYGPSIDDRYCFYLAQTYRDMKNYDKAIHWYSLRSKKGWEEERWYSMYMIARCLELMGKDPVKSYIEAYEFRQHRAEPLFHLAIYLLKKERYSEAFIYINTAKDIPYPNQDVLFIEYKLYDYIIDSLWTTLVEKHQEIIRKSLGPLTTDKEKERVLRLENEITEISSNIILRNDIPVEEKVPVLSGIKHAADLIDSYNLMEIDIPDGKDVISTSLISLNRKYYYLVQRENNYLVYELNQTYEIVRLVSEGTRKLNNPTLVKSKGKIYIKVDNENGFSLVNMEGVESKAIEGRNGIFYTFIDSTQNVFSFEENFNISTEKITKIVNDKYYLGYIEIIPNPIQTKNGLILLCKFVNTEVYTFVLIKEFKLIKVTKPFKIGKMENISSIDADIRGNINLLFGTKVVIFWVKYVFEMFHGTK